MELIVDKSFLDAASPQEISEIWETYFVIMPDILFFELMSTREEAENIALANFLTSTVRWLYFQVLASCLAMKSIRNDLAFRYQNDV